MTETNGNKPGEARRDTDGPFASAVRLSSTTIRGQITSRLRADVGSPAPKEALTEVPERIEWSKRLTMVVSSSTMGNIGQLFKQCTVPNTEGVPNEECLGNGVIVL